MAATLRFLGLTLEISLVLIPAGLGTDLQTQRQCGDLRRREDRPVHGRSHRLAGWQAGKRIAASKRLYRTQGLGSRRPGVFVGQGRGSVPLDDPNAPLKRNCAILDGVSYCH